MDFKYIDKVKWAVHPRLADIILIPTLFAFLVTYSGFQPAESRFQFFILCISLALLAIAYLIKVTRYGQSFSITLIDIFYVTSLCCPILARYIFSAEYFFTYDVQDDIALLIMYIVFRGLITDDFPALIFKFGGIICLFYLIEVLIGISQNLNFWDLSTSQERVKGSFINNTIYSHFLIINLPFLAIFLRNKHSWRIWLLKIIALGIVILLIRESRISLIALPISVIFIFNLTVRKIKVGATPWVLLLILIFIFGSILASSNVDSLKGRVLVWQIGSNIFKDFPIAGVGHGNFKVVYPNYQYAFFKYSDDSLAFQQLAGDINEPYNEILNLLIEQGLIGLIMHLLVIFIIIKNVIKDPDEFKKYLLISLGLFYFIGMSSYPLNSLPLKANYLFIIMLFSISSKPFIVLKNSRKVGIVIIAIILYICSVLNYRNLKEFIGIKSWIFYNTYSKTSDEIFAQAIEDTPDNLKYNIYYLLDRANFQYRKHDRQACIETVSYSKGLTKNSYFFILHAKALIELKKYDLAYSELEFVTHLIPNLVYPKYLMVKVLLNMQKETEALQLIDEILEMPIKVRTAAIDEITDEMYKLKIVLNNK